MPYHGHRAVQHSAADLYEAAVARPHAVTGAYFRLCAHGVSRDVVDEPAALDPGRNRQPLLVVIVMQAAVAVAFIVLALFPLLGRGYQAAVPSAGFIGLSLGATPTAIASMTAVTEHYGPSPNAFIILPLISAFFVDIINVIAIKVFLSL